MLNFTLEDNNLKHQFAKKEEGILSGMIQSALISSSMTLRLEFKYGMTIPSLMIS
jgi:hypothetical protein